MTINGRVSPFRNLRIEACLPAPRSLSQATTSFIASRCQGIHHTLLIASSTRPSTGNLHHQHPVRFTRWDDYPATRRGHYSTHPGGCALQRRHGQAPQTLALGVTFKNSATPKNLSNCQRAMSPAEAFDVSPQMRAGLHGLDMLPGSKLGRGVYWFFSSCQA